MSFNERVAQIWNQLGAFLGLVGRQFGRHQGPQNAAALTYASLLSLVPLMAVSLAIFYAFPIAHEVQQDVQNFLFKNFVPASSEVLRENLQAFSDKASKLNGVSSVFLVIVTLMMMSNIDRALNTIWEVRRKRSALSKFLMYWSVLTLGPVLIGLSLVATSYLVSLPFLSDAAASGVGRRLLGLSPVLASLLAFSLMYAAVPNVRVRLAHALTGGLVAALLFEAAKRGFAYYVTSFPTYQAIYGAMAAIPIFLVWIYLSWLVVLLGAEVAHCLRLFHWGKANPHGRELGLTDTVLLLLLLDEAAGSGEARSSGALVRAHPGWREDQIEALLERMGGWHWVHQTRDSRWSLARRLDDLSLHEVQQRSGFTLPREEALDWPSDPVLAERLRQGNQALAQALSVSLAEFRLQRAEPQTLDRQRVTPE
jgi:membrane protein